MIMSEARSPTKFSCLVCKQSLNGEIWFPDQCSSFADQSLLIAYVYSVCVAFFCLEMSARPENEAAKGDQSGH